MEKKMKTIRLLIVIAFLLTACATKTPVPTAVVEQPTIEQPTETPLPVPTETALPAPTATAQPTAIPATSTPDATQQAQANILPLVAPCKFAANSAISYSPKNLWVVVSCQGNKPEDGIITKFTRRNASKQWNISFNDSYIKVYRPNDANVNDLLKKTFIPVHWTMNEDFVYLAVQTSTEKAPYAGYDGLLRLDLSTGKTSAIIKPATAPIVAKYAFKFSLSGTKLAYINQSARPLSIVIDDATTGEENRITLDARFGQAGNLLWSPDEKQLLVSAIDTNANGGNSVILYDLAANKNTYIIQQSATIYLPVEWLDGNIIYAESYPDKWVTIDLAAKAITDASAPTPAP